MVKDKVGVERRERGGGGLMTSIWVRSIVKETFLKSSIEIFYFREKMFVFRNGNNIVLFYKEL